MEPIVEPVPESRLADVLLGELCPRPEADDTYVDIILEDLELVEPDDDDDEYALFQVVRDPFATTEFVRVRDTSRDHVVTVRFPRGVLEDETVEIPQVSAPYERIEIETVIVADSAPADSADAASRGPNRLARGTDASSIIGANHAAEAPCGPGVLARGVLAPKVVVPRVVMPKVAAPKLAARVPAPREADAVRMPDRLARGTDASSLVSAPSVPDVAPHEADDPMPDGIDVSFDAEDSMPDILDVWLEQPADGADVPGEESDARFMSYTHALPFPLYSAPFERVELGELPAAARAWPDDATDVLVPAPRRSTATRVILTSLVLACALALGVGLAVLVMRAST